MGNSYGSTYETRTMDYFDRLPRSARAAIADARFDWALAPWLKAFESGRIKARDLVKKIESVDRLESAKVRRRTWGPDYPILKGELASAPRTKKKARR